MASNKPDATSTHRYEPLICMFRNIYGCGVSIFDATTFQPFRSSQLNESLVPGFGRILDTETANLAVGYIHTFSSDFLNELRFGWLNVRGGQTGENRGVDFASAAGLKGVTSLICRRTCAISLPRKRCRVSIIAIGS